MPQVSVYVHNPMGNCVSDLYPRHPTAHRLGHGNVFDFPGVCFVMEDQESKSLNDRTGPAIIISSSIVCPGLGTRCCSWATRPRAPWTACKTEIKMFGEMVPVRCHVAHLDGFSAHADRSELLRWLGQFQTPPKRTFVVHGEPAPVEALAQTLRQEKG